MCLGDDSRISREQAVDVGVDLAHIGMQGSRERNRGGIGTASAQSRHIIIVRNSLETGDNCDLAFRD